ncbi:MAG: hypothetical protein FJ126_04310 [Deltaproteobacteria bacterium]|nr:hypothetical protein [Deltaproteobacteria bacterium]
MRKLIVALMVGSLVLAGIGLATAADLPQALKGVDLKTAQQVTDTQAQNVRGAAQANVNPIAGDGIPNNYLFLVPGPHKLDR